MSQAAWVKTTAIGMVSMPIAGVSQAAAGGVGKDSRFDEVGPHQSGSVRVVKELVSRSNGAIRMGSNPISRKYSLFQSLYKGYNVYLYCKSAQEILSRSFQDEEEAKARRNAQIRSISLERP